MKTLTKAEEEIMQILWQLKGGFLREVVYEFPDPKPHQNTVATILKILVEKGFVEVEPYGRNHKYLPTIKKEQYAKSRTKSLVKKYYDGSFTSIVSSMVKDKNLSIKDLESLLDELTKKK